MSEWISIEKEKPKSPWHIVLATDGIAVILARWIQEPKKWYGENLMVWDDQLNDEIQLEEEFHDSHWEIESLVHINGEECFHSLNNITHWMELPSTDSIVEHSQDTE